jgi:hypothetical protein
MEITSGLRADPVVNGHRASLVSQHGSERGRITGPVNAVCGQRPYCFTFPLQRNGLWPIVVWTDLWSINSRNTSTGVPASACRWA